MRQHKHDLHTGKSFLKADPILVYTELRLLVTVQCIMGPHLFAMLVHIHNYPQY